MERTVINAVLLVLLLSIIGALLFYQPIQPLPAIMQDTINKIPMYSTLAQSQREVENNIANIESLEQQIQEMKRQADTLGQAPVQKQYTSNDVDWKLNIPQLLIYLDKGAVQNKVDLDINYNKANELSGLAIQTTNNTSQGAIATNNPNGQVNATQPTATNVQGQPATQLGQDPNQQPNNNNMAPGQPTVGAQTPGGFSNYIVPIRVYGAYGDIINYIKYCTKTSFIVPYSMHISFDNETNKVKADMVLRVLYIK